MAMIKCRKCGKEIFYHDPSDVPWFPFCSERCKLVDLGKWLDEEHRISTPIDKKDEVERPIHRDKPEADSGVSDDSDGAAG